MPDPSAQAFTAAGIYRNGVTVTFQRLSGYAPNVTTISATVTAMVQTVIADATAETETGLSSSAVGSISQDDRLVLVMNADLVAQNYPVPVLKGDQVTIPYTSETMIVARVDSLKRVLTGAVEVYITGVS